MRKAASAISCAYACWGAYLPVPTCARSGGEPSLVMLCRLAWVAGFCIGPFGGNERTWKPFNPILGETFELDLPSNGVRFLAEQVWLPLRPAY